MNGKYYFVVELSEYVVFYFYQSIDYFSYFDVQLKRLKIIIYYMHGIIQ